MTKSEWYNKNKDYLEFYYKTYNFLKKNSLPFSEKYLVDYYKSEMDQSGFSYNPNILSNYEFLFEFYIGSESQKHGLIINTDLIKQKSKTERIINTAIKKTSEDFQSVGTTISDGISEIWYTSKTFLFIIVFIIAFLIYSGKIKL